MLLPALRHYMSAAWYSECIFDGHRRRRSIAFRDHLGDTIAAQFVVHFWLNVKRRASLSDGGGTLDGRPNEWWLDARQAGALPTHRQNCYPLEPSADNYK